MIQNLIRVLVAALIGLSVTAVTSLSAAAGDTVSTQAAIIVRDAAPTVALRPDPGGPVICPGQSTDHIHKWYTAMWGTRVPLRCGTWSGTKGFGVRKLAAKNRWNPWYKAMIAITLRNPRTIEKDGTTWVYRTRTFYECTPNYHFRVVVQTAKVGGTKRMRGIITAYQKFE